MLLISAVFCTANAQSISPDIQSDLQLPVIFSTGRDQLSCLLFYADERQPKDVFKFQLAILNAQDQLEQLHPVSDIKAIRAGDKRLKLLCNYTNDLAYCAFFETNEGIYGVSIDRTTFQVSAKLVGTMPEDEEVLGGISLDASTLILTRGGDRKKGRSLHIYRPDGDGMKKTSFASELPAFFHRDEYSPQLIKKSVDLRPDDAVSNGKIFAEANKIYLTYEKKPSVYSNGILNLTLVTIDLEYDSLYAEVIDFPNYGATPGASGSSFIFEGKLFQFYYDETELGLMVCSLPEMKILFESLISGDDSLSLLNSMVNRPGFLTQSAAKKVNTGSKLLQILIPLKPYIYVKKYLGEYLIGLGGYGVETNYGDGGIVTGKLGSGPFGGYAYSYESATSFYCILNDACQEVSQRWLNETFFTKINQVKAPENGEFVQMNGQSKYIYLSRSDDQQGKALSIISLPGY